MFQELRNGLEGIEISNDAEVSRAFYLSLQNIIDDLCGIIGYLGDTGSGARLVPDKFVLDSILSYAPEECQALRELAVHRAA